MKRAILILLLCAATASAAERPDLVVVISIDQFRYDYLTKFKPYFSPDGFRRFLDRGADFPNSYYPYATTFTGPGHAAIGTGYTPSQNGIVGNVWFDRTTSRAIYCVGDARAAGGYSPVNLHSDALGDRLQEKFNGARVYGVAIKDRAAILMAGRKATAAYWFEPKIGFTSSSYYRYNSTLLAAHNATLPAYLAEHPSWTQSSFIPAADLAKLTHDPESLRKFKTERPGYGTSFPHPIQSLDSITYSPFGNGLVIGFAQRLIETERLGVTGAAPDLIFVGLSSPDYLGHAFGPDSLEVADCVVRTDRDIAGFLAWLDQKYGNRYTVALTADHGVQSIPEIARDMGRDAGRVSFRNAGPNTKTLADLAAIAPARVELERLTAASLNVPFANDAPVSQGLIQFFEEPAVYLNWARIAELKLDGERVKRAMRDAALKLKGMDTAFTNTELMTTNANPAPLELMMRRSFRADRSGDVLMALKAGYAWDYNGTGANHGQPVEDDMHVPVMLWGRGVTAKRYELRAAPTDLAKSLGSLFGVDAGGPETKILPCMAAADTQAVIRAAIAKAPKFERLIRGERLPADLLAGVDFAASTETATESLPGGYARLDRIEINADKATVTLWYGPIPKPQPGVMMLACGTGYTFQLQRDANGEWQVTGPPGVAVC